MYRKLFCVAALAAVSALNASAAVTVQPVGSVWFEQLLQWPLSLFFGPTVPATITVDEHIPDIGPAPCLVSPLAEITDEGALEFEANRGTADVIQTSGMTPAASMALEEFESLVSSFGGSVTLKSAYRPPAYQDHLQQVWDKWMIELKDNIVPECQELRNQVYEEFAGHDLLESQRPAGISDHSRGTAFDAAVYLPYRGKQFSKKINVDTLAWRAGLYRPVAFQDPVHFRYGLPKIAHVAKTKKTSRRRS